MVHAKKRELVRWGRGRQPAKLAGWVYIKSEKMDGPFKKDP